MVIWQENIPFLPQNLLYDPQNLVLIAMDTTQNNARLRLSGNFSIRVKYLFDPLPCMTPAHIYLPTVKEIQNGKWDEIFPRTPGGEPHCQKRKEDTDTPNGMRGHSLNHRSVASRSGSGFATVVGSCGAMSARRSMENLRILPRALVAWAVTLVGASTGDSTAQPPLTPRCSTPNLAHFHHELCGIFVSLQHLSESSALINVLHVSVHLDHPAWTAPDAGGRSAGHGIFLRSRSRGVTNNYLVQLPPPSPALSRRTTSWWNINQTAPEFLRIASDAESDRDGEMPTFPNTPASMLPASPASLPSTSASSTPGSRAPPSRRRVFFGPPHLGWVIYQHLVIGDRSSRLSLGPENITAHHLDINNRRLGKHGCRNIKRAG
ncbi:hypothetical protein C8R44DRAFT_741225 [Mycena epipterygia]|nr:hypothetical protein C8R44DRAFT_741225 [Mycena epipterygia]